MFGPLGHFFTLQSAQTLLMLITFIPGQTGSQRGPLIYSNYKFTTLFWSKVLCNGAHSAAEIQFLPMFLLLAYGGEQTRAARTGKKSPQSERRRMREILTESVAAYPKRSMAHANACFLPRVLVTVYALFHNNSNRRR